MCALCQRGVNVSGIKLHHTANAQEKAPSVRAGGAARAMPRCWGASLCRGLDIPGRHCRDAGYSAKVIRGNLRDIGQAREGVRDGAALGTRHDMACGKPWGKWFNLDHKLARECGGSDHWTNLQWLCASCHSRKTAARDGGFGNMPRR